MGPIPKPNSHLFFFTTRGKGTEVEETNHHFHPFYPYLGDTTTPTLTHTNNTTKPTYPYAHLGHSWSTRNSTRRPANSLPRVKELLDRDKTYLADITGLALTQAGPLVTPT